MSSITLIFPHQLFKQHPALETGRPVILVEEFLFFSQYNFHKKKIIFHRASMKWYMTYLEQNGYKVDYAERIDVREQIGKLGGCGITNIVVADPVDDWLSMRMHHACKSKDILLTVMPTPNFLNTISGVDAFFRNRKTYFQTDFYTWQRRSRKILVDKTDQPLGGQWSFDAENRERFPKQSKAPGITWSPDNEFVKEATLYAKKHFPTAPGDGSNFGYPVNYKDAERWFEDFLQQRFREFGPYEDAMVREENFLHHAVISPMLNTGLLDPEHIIHRAITFAFDNQIPMNSLEGFIRQVMGWREFIRIVYEREGRKQRTRNHFGFTRRIPRIFWTGNTGIEPVDCVIGHTLQHGYTHHINRLMVLGNFMLLCEFDPDEVYRWFMEMYIDAYDWVMVPNVYGMTQFADGGMMTTKP